LFGFVRVAKNNIAVLVDDVAKVFGESAEQGAKTLAGSDRGPASVTGQTQSESSRGHGGLVFAGQLCFAG
jgi:hypothetical protein